MSNKTDDTMSKKALKIHPDDTLIVALQDLTVGERIVIDNDVYTVEEPIRSKHKFAAKDFLAGDLLTQYGITVGEAIVDIKQGCVITTENTRHSSQTYGQNSTEYQWQQPHVDTWKERKIKGFRRDNGTIGTANYWLVVPLVFCQNRNIEMLRTALQDALGYSNETHYIDLARSLVSQYQSTDSAALAEHGK